MRTPLHDQDFSFTPVSHIKIRNLQLEIYHIVLIYSRTELTVTTSETHVRILLRVVFRYLDQFYPEIREVLLTGYYLFRSCLC